MLPFYSFTIFAIKTWINIAANKLNIDELKARFEKTTIFSNKDILNFYKRFEHDLKPSTVNWRVYKLVQLGLLNRVGRGKFSIGEIKNYLPELKPKIYSLNKKLKKQFPFLTICLWDTSILNEFMVHQPAKFYLLVEVEKEAMESVFYFLRGNKYPVYLNPGSEIIEKYLSSEKDAVIIKQLVTEAPVQNIKDVTTTTIEKMLVDIFCDDIIFSAQQGSEMKNIFNEAFNKYTVNENRLLRYADRRRKKELLIKYLKTIPLKPAA